MKPITPPGCERLLRSRLSTGSVQAAGGSRPSCQRSAPCDRAQAQPLRVGERGRRALALATVSAFDRPAVRVRPESDRRPPRSPAAQIHPDAPHAIQKSASGTQREPRCLPLTATEATALARLPAFNDGVIASHHLAHPRDPPAESSIHNNYALLRTSASYCLLASFAHHHAIHHNIFFIAARYYRFSAQPRAAVRSLPTFPTLLPRSRFIIARRCSTRTSPHRISTLLCATLSSTAPQPALAHLPRSPSYPHSASSSASSNDSRSAGRRRVATHVDRKAALLCRIARFGILAHDATDRGSLSPGVARAAGGSRPSCQRSARWRPRASTTVSRRRARAPGPRACDRLRLRSSSGSFPP